jgi:DNA-directed RNA polymerase specialized sigma24 family protein
MDDPTDPEDVRRIGSDPVALEAFYTAHYDAVVRYLARRVDDPHDVADLVADTFLTALESAPGFDPARGRPLAWLLGAPGPRRVRLALPG